MSDFGFKALKIESPSSNHIVQRTRTNINTLDPILRHYFTPHEIQFHAEALQDRLTFFLQCKGSKNSLQFIVPPSAVEVNKNKTNLLEHFSFQAFVTWSRSQFSCHNSDITTKTTSFGTCRSIHLLRNNIWQKSRNVCFRFHSRLIKYSILLFKIKRNQNLVFFSPHVSDGTSVFTKRLYPKVLPQTGIHFFNLPCQATSWYPSMNCPSIGKSSSCKYQECNAREKQMKELKCNTPVCTGQDICIPVYFNPTNFQASVCAFLCFVEKSNFLFFLSFYDLNRKFCTIHKLVSL